MDVQQFYDQNGDKYLNVIRSNISPLPLINQYSLSSIASNENICFDNANIIDIGCGDGTFARFLAAKYENINKITGIDLSNTMIDNAKRQRSNSDKIEYYQGDILKFSTLETQNIKRSSYDVAIVFFVLNYASTIQELDTMIKNICLLLKPNGCIIGLNPCPFHHRLINAANNEYYNKYGFRMYINKELTNLYDGYKYKADVYAFDNSKSVSNPKGNMIHFDGGYFYTHNTFNNCAKKYGFTQWKWINYLIPDMVKESHQQIDWEGLPLSSPDMFFYAKKSLKAHSKL